MAEDLCAPYAQCEGLDGRLLINRTADGPAIAADLAELPLGPVTMQGATLHPYVRWTYGQTWAAKEACLGPARSVLGLAPGETVTIEVTHRESIDTIRLVRDAADRSNTISKTERRPQSGSVSIDQQRPDGGSQAAEQLKDKLQKLREEQQEIQRSTRLAMSGSWNGQVELQPIHYGELGSPFLELVAGAIIGAVVSGSNEASREAALEAAAEQMAHESRGGPGTINHDTQQRIGEIVDEVERTESQSSVSEKTTVTRESSEQRIRRTFSNPYRDRSLELRFFPVFRRFEITTSLLRAEPGVLLRPGLVKFAGSGLRARIAPFVEAGLDATAVAATALADPGDEREGAAVLRTSALSEHLAGNAELYTRRFVEYADQSGSQDALMAPFARMIGPTPGVRRAGAAAAATSLADGLAWSRAQVKNGEIHVPFAEPDNWPASWKEAGAGLLKGIKETVGSAPWRQQWTSTREVHLYMGTHVEAVAGTCVLEDVPEPG
jgi:hypothetical protein